MVDARARARVSRKRVWEMHAYGNLLLVWYKKINSKNSIIIGGFVFEKEGVSVT
jgi:hypothetical protein